MKLSNGAHRRLFSLGKYSLDFYFKKFMWTFGMQKLDLGIRHGEFIAYVVIIGGLVVSFSKNGRLKYK